jgi:hypothetical protein
MTNESIDQHLKSRDAIIAQKNAQYAQKTIRFQEGVHVEVLKYKEFSFDRSGNPYVTLSLSEKPFPVELRVARQNGQYALKPGKLAREFQEARAQVVPMDKQVLEEMLDVYEN